MVRPNSRRAVMRLRRIRIAISIELKRRTRPAMRDNFIKASDRFKFCMDN